MASVVEATVPQITKAPDAPEPLSSLERRSIRGDCPVRQ
jgi:hypothetical protein